MYSADLEIKDITDSTTSAFYLNLLLSIGRDGQLHTSIYDKWDDFNFHITNFPFLSSDIPSSPTYGVFISQIIRYARANLIKMRLDISVTLRFPPFLYNSWIEEERRETEISSLILIRLRPGLLLVWMFYSEAQATFQ